MIKFQFGFLTLLGGIAGLAIGITLLADYHHDNVQSNAFGLVTNVSKCMLDCQPIISKYKNCQSSGTVDVMYEYFNQTTGIYYDTIKVPGFCTQDCCWADMKKGTTIYFYVKDGVVNHASSTVVYNTHVFLIIGIIVVTLGIVIIFYGVFLWYQSCRVVISTDRQHREVLYSNL